MNLKKINTPLYVAWVALPLAWGFIMWLATQGFPIISTIPYSILLLAATLIACFTFRHYLSHLQNEYAAHFFEYRLKLPSWRLLAFITVVGLLVRIFLMNALDIPSSAFPILNSVISGVLASAFLEELLARTLFVGAPLSTISFLLLNTLSSLAFSIMHVGFDQDPLPLLDYIFVRGHFTFSFALGLLAYKTKRIELGILMHMFSNACNYTLPALVLGSAWRAPLSLISGTLLFALVGGSSYKKQQK